MTVARESLEVEKTVSPGVVNQVLVCVYLIPGFDYHTYKPVYQRATFFLKSCRYWLLNLFEDCTTALIRTAGELARGNAMIIEYGCAD